MKTPHFLLASSNVVKMRENLQTTLNSDGINAINDAIKTNAKEILILSKYHLSFALSLHEQFWRQIVSRLYYSGYIASRAVRFISNGAFSMDVEDHKRSTNLPDDFPQRSTYANRLAILREDRNLCDYDHSIVEQDLVLGRIDSIIFANEFYNDSNKYLLSHGVTL